jgi:mRNA-degrading endonuclease RelE of RelBE toxin-antitoxin system
VSAALQIFSRDFDADFFKLPAEVQRRIETAVDRLGMNIKIHSHKRMKGIEAFRLRVGDYRVIYDSILQREFYICSVWATGARFIAK